MTAMRTFVTSLVLIGLFAFSSPVLGQEADVMTVHDLAFDGDGATLAVRVEAGVLLHDLADDVTFLCASSWQEAGAEAQWLVQTAPARPLLVGSLGPFLALETGCEWARISGPADSAEVVGIHAREPGGDSVLFAVTSAFGPDEVLRTDDGGFTSSNPGGFAQLDKRLTGMVGEGDTVIVSGVTMVSESWIAWISMDAGESFTELELDTEEGGELLGLGGQTLWLLGDSDVTAYDLETGSKLSAIPVAGAVVSHAVTAAGALWFATSQGRLHQEDPDSGASESYDIAATSIVVHSGSVWVGLVAPLPGDPLWMTLDAGENTWEVAGTRPIVWSYPEGCQTLLSQVCAEDSERLMPRETDEPDPELVASGSSEDGCASGPGTRGFPLELYVFLALFFAARHLGRSSRNGRPTASP